MLGRKQTSSPTRSSSKRGRQEKSARQVSALPSSPEFSLTTADTRRGRLDLFLIDPGNKIIVTIENKAGASLTETQLSDYYAAVSQQISNRRVFSDYQFAYIVVDRDLADYPEEHLKSLGNKWALLDYGWLEASANRARLHLERNNRSSPVAHGVLPEADWVAESKRKAGQRACRGTCFPA